MRADKGRIGDQRTAILDERQLALGRVARLGAFLGKGETGHLELDLGLGGEGADFRQAEARAAAEQGDGVHEVAP